MASFFYIKLVQPSIRSNAFVALKYNGHYAYVSVPKLIRGTMNGISSILNFLTKNSVLANQCQIFKFNADTNQIKQIHDREELEFEYENAIKVSRGRVPDVEGAMYHILVDDTPIRARNRPKIFYSGGTVRAYMSSLIKRQESNRKYFGGHTVDLSKYTIVEVVHESDQIHVKSIKKIPVYEFLLRSKATAKSLSGINLRGIE